MNILGLHFGHDAAVAVLRDGEVLSYVLRERHCRTKHAISLEMRTIDAALAAAGVTAADIDCVAVTSTQDIELIIDDGARLSVSTQAHPSATARGSYIDALARAKCDLRTFRSGGLLRSLHDPQQRNTLQYQAFRHFYPEHKTRDPEKTALFDWIDLYIGHSQWQRESTLGEIGSTNFGPLFQADDIRLGFHLPATVTLDGRDLPAYYVNHHAAHAASVFYGSGFDEAAIFTHDGFGNGITYLGGMFFWGKGGRIYPITPHHLAIGALYENMGDFLGLGDIGPAGKLMGLAAYGKPRFFDRAFVGNWYDWQKLKFDAVAWVNHCGNSADAAGYDMSALQSGRFADATKVLSPLSVDFAASTQKLFEETYLAAVEVLHKSFARSGHLTKNLCMSGGAALNCPANGRIFREGPFPNIYIEPGCDDSGIAIGAAQFILHNVLDKPLPSRGSSRQCVVPYMGVEITETQIDAALSAVADRITVTHPEDAAHAAAEDLAADRIMGWFEGRSEIGPRALGHRSILADARKAENWPRVNRMKGRELWRPFAPAVLASEAHRWFRGTPLPSPHMLYTGSVCTNELPAITHADGSTRLQTVDESCGEFYRVLVRFYELTKMPVVLNTSFNGPGEPIVESPDDAVRFLLNSSLDALYMGGHRITRKS